MSRTPIVELRLRRRMAGPLYKACYAAVVTWVSLTMLSFPTATLIKRSIFTLCKEDTLHRRDVLKSSVSRNDLVLNSVNLDPRAFSKMERGKRPWHRLLTSAISLVYNLIQLIYLKPYNCISAWRKNYA